MLPGRRTKTSPNSALAVSALHGRRSVQTAVNIGQTIGEALADLRARTIDHPVVYVYVLDDDDRLVGQLPTRALLFAAPDTPVREAMRKELTTISMETSLDDALAACRRNRCRAVRPREP